LPPLVAPGGREVAAVRGLVQTLLTLLRQDGVTHVACAFDHVIESFRNNLFAGYKTGAGVPEDLLGQFGLAERAAASLGIVVWPMVEFEADDAIATAAARWWDASGVEQVIMCSPDKDLAQMVRDDRVVVLDRRQSLILNEAAVMEKFGVAPKSIPDYLALVGDPADGIPGIPRWGAKTAAAMLGRYGYIEQIPGDFSQWDVKVRGARAIADSLAELREAALLYKKLATLRLDATITEALDHLEWRGVRREEFYDLCQELGFSRLMELPYRWADV
jgi:5'-3' exonuclease